MNEKISDFIKEHEETLNQITAFMLEYNSHTNLTRITEPEEIIQKHYIDSIMPFYVIDVPRGTQDKSIPQRGNSLPPSGVSRRELNSSSCLLSGRSPSRVGFAHSTGHATDTATLVLQDKSIPQRGNSLPPSGVSRREQDKSWRGGSADTSAHVLLRQANPSKTAKPPLRDALSSCSLLDVGSGAGFPGIPIKLLYPELQVSLLDSAKKRCDYLRSLLEHIKLPCEVLQGRSEELSILPQYREQYDFVTARAVANLSALCEYCLPFAKVGGRFFAMKGSNAHEELAVAENAITLLGGSVSDVYDYELPDGAKRVLVIIDKIKPTPKEYPRQRVNISKKPVR